MDYIYFVYIYIMNDIKGKGILYKNTYTYPSSEPFFTGPIIVQKTSKILKGNR